VSRAQLLDDDQSPPSDSQVEDESQASQEDEPETQEDRPETPESSPRPEPQPDFAQTMNQTRQEDQKKGLAVSRQLVRLADLFSHYYLTF
jgi:hypothetical protein